MRELLKTDLRRIIKDKLFLIVCIVGAGFALFTPFLYKGLSLLVGIEDELLGLFTNSKSIFFTSFSLSGNFGLILPILLAIVLCKDFSYGTVRNKIICGKSRAKIFLSMFLSGTIVACGVILAHALLTLGISLCFFPYQEEAFTANSALYMLLSIFFSLLLYVFVSAIVCFLCVSMKNVGLAIVVYVAINFLFSIVAAIMSVASIFVDHADKFAVKAFEILQKANVFNATYIGTGTSYTLTDVLCVLVPVVAGTALCLLLGVTVFRKKDLK